MRIQLIKIQNWIILHVLQQWFQYICVSLDALEDYSAVLWYCDGCKIKYLKKTKKKWVLIEYLHCFLNFFFFFVSVEVNISWNNVCFKAKSLLTMFYLHSITKSLNMNLAYHFQIYFLLLIIKRYIKWLPIFSI